MEGKMIYRFIIIGLLLLMIFSFADGSELEELYHHRNLGGAYFEEDKLAEAIQEFTECIKINPNFAQDHINLGMAYLDYSKYPEAIQELETAQKLAPGYPHIYYNLAIVYKRQGKFEEAAREFQKVIELDANDAATRYNLGICYSRLQETAKAEAEFRRVVELEPEHSGAHYHLWRIALREGKTEEADKELKIFQYLRQSTEKEGTSSSARELEEGKYTKLIAIPPEKQERPQSVPVQFKEHRLEIPPSPLYQRGEKGGISQLKANIGSGMAFGDYDNDGDLDVYVTNFGANTLFRNDGNDVFTDVTAQAGVGDTGIGLSCAFGDYDNDGDLDLYVGNVGANVLYRNEGDGHFTDVTAKAGVPSSSGQVGDSSPLPTPAPPKEGKKGARGLSSCSADVAFVDYDHDGDLDLYVANYVALPAPLFPPRDGGMEGGGESLPGQANTLYRNNGDGTFTDVTNEAGVGGDARKSRQILLTDFDNDNDIDLYIVNEGAPNILYTNLRGGKFKDVTEQIMPKDSTGGLNATIGDYNADGRMDIYLATSEGSKNVLYRNESPNGFAMESKSKSILNAKLHVLQSGFLDYDNDGYLDLFLLVQGSNPDQPSRAFLFRNKGNRDFEDVSKETGLSQITLKNSRRFILGDYDNDGDTDILVRNDEQSPTTSPLSKGVKGLYGKGEDGALTLLRNEGGNANNWLKVRLTGKKNNKDGIASKLEAKAGIFYQKREVFNRTIDIGLGSIAKLDAVRVEWPNGILQNSIDVQANQTLTLPEKEGPPGSCPFLYVWDGKQYTLIADFLDVTALGVLADENTYLMLDSDECVKIDGNRIKPTDDLYLMQITEELNEIVYLDELKLLAVDHPADVDIYPNEMFITSPPFPEFHIYAVKNARPPVSAIDHNGNDILTAISKRDRIYPHVQPLGYLGMAEEHSVILDLGDLSKAKKILLLLTGWVNWGDSTANLAVAQNRLVDAISPYLQVINSQGEWETVIPSLGFHAGLDKTATIDLTGKFLTNDYRIKITTNMEIYWDRILVSTVVDDNLPMNTTPLKFHSADLHWYGYSRDYSPDGRLPMLYEYNTASDFSPWRHAKGRFTRYGDVLPLLLKSDNQYAIMSHGDEISVSFDARTAPPLPPGWTRDFVLYSSGWIKDGDPNTADSTTVGPMPFHGMSGYPYPPNESYPYSLENIKYIQEYNTRVINR
jgi:lipoprotein NlpI